MILAENSYTESNYAFVFSKEKVNLENSDENTNNKIEEAASKKNKHLIKGTIMTCDVFDPYVDWKAIYDRIPKELNVLGTEMEAFALFHIAKTLNKKAACMLTVVDSKCTDKIISSEDREKKLKDMIEIALDSILL